MDLSAFLSADKYLKAFPEISEIHDVQEKTLKAMIAEIESQYSELLNPKEEKQDQFLLPVKRIGKKSTRRETRAAFKKNTSFVNNKAEDDNKTCRRSTRIAAKTMPGTSFENSANKVKPKNNCVEMHDADYLESNPQNHGRLEGSTYSVCTVDMEYPLGTSTPDLSMDIAVDNENRLKNEENVELSDEKNKTPFSNINIQKENFENLATDEQHPTEMPFENLCNAPKTDKLRKPVVQKNFTKIGKLLGTMKLVEEEKEEREKPKLNELKKHDSAQDEFPQYEIADSSEDEDHPKKQIPSWATKKKREYPINVQAWLNKRETVHAWFYRKNLENPKLEELFSKEVRTRPRASSALWNSKLCFNESFPVV